MSIALQPAVEQLALLRRGKVSALELADEYIARVERLNPALNAFVDFIPERVRQQARESQAGSLAGLPVSIKSSIEVAGHRCEIGSRVRSGQIADQDAEAVGQLRSAGGVILGTTNCPEFLMAYETDNLLNGRTNNPWDLSRNAGGSSGGESAAIAAGLSAGGLGSDSGGSVREPAHFTGICALKPTPARVSAFGHRPPCVGPFLTMGAIGPMARTIADVELLFQVLVSRPGTEVAYRAVTLDQARDATIGWFEDDGHIPVTEDTRQAIHSAVRALDAAGFRTVYHRPALLEEARLLWRTFFLQCGAMFYEPEIRGNRERLSPTFQDFLREAEAEPPLSAARLLSAWAETDLLCQRLSVEMKATPILLTPVCSVPAFRAGEREWMVDGVRVGYWDAMRYTQWFNLLAAPAAVVPVGRSKDGLPIGVQIAGRPGEDALVLAVADVLDRTFGYEVPPFAA